ncbi:MAG TPA: 50S ribosomal protein L24 [Candidatus Nanoarchaeia archaeon]|nr:50S ribosomal protein L24 [Candidatus Nanoarchaeia archaeon]
MKKYSKHWASSTKARKQRKLRGNMPLHLRKKLVRVHLSKTLRQTHKKRSLTARVGDKVTILRGQFRKKSGKIERVDRKYTRLFIEGVEIVKKDGTKALFPVHPSNVLLTELAVDKRRIEGVK